MHAALCRTVSHAQVCILSCFKSVDITQHLQKNVSFSVLFLKKVWCPQMHSETLPYLFAEQIGGLVPVAWQNVTSLQCSSGHWWTLPITIRKQWREQILGELGEGCVICLCIQEAAKIVKYTSPSVWNRHSWIPCTQTRKQNIYPYNFQCIWLSIWEPFHLWYWKLNSNRHHQFFSMFESAQPN